LNNVPNQTADAELQSYIVYSLYNVFINLPVDDNIIRRLFLSVDNCQCV